MDAPGLVHYVWAGGIERRKIFLSDDDRLDFLGRLEKASAEDGVLPNSPTIFLNMASIIYYIMLFPMIAYRVPGNAAHSGCYLSTSINSSLARCAS